MNETIEAPAPVLQPQQKPKTADWMSRASFFLGAVLFHLLLFLMLATFVIFKAPEVPHETTEFQAVKIAVPPPPPAPPAASGNAASSPVEPTITVTPPAAAPSAITTSASAFFNVAAVKVALPSLANLSPQMGSGLSGSGASGSHAGTGSVFGSEDNNGNGFTGYFYDLKQTPDYKDTGMDEEKEQKILKQFFKDGWNEDAWATQFLKSSKPLYANELMVPLRLSKEGPKAFGMEKVSQPGYWCIIYHLKVSAGHSGNYRLAGYGDDFLVARVNGQTVLDSGWFPPVTNFKREKIYAPNWLQHRNATHSEYGQTVVGLPFRLEVAESVTIDVLVGDANPQNGFGMCGYFLFLVQDGKDYDKDPKDNPLLPVLQVQPSPNLKREGDYPPFTSNPEDAILGS